MSAQVYKCSACSAVVQAGPNDPCRKCGGVLLPYQTPATSPAEKAAKGVAEAAAEVADDVRRHFLLGAFCYLASGVFCVGGFAVAILLPATGDTVIAKFQFATLLVLIGVLFAVIGSAYMICRTIAENRARR